MVHETGIIILKCSGGKWSYGNGQATDLWIDVIDLLNSILDVARIDSL